MTQKTSIAEEKKSRELVSEFLSLFYEKGWVAGTGGGICAALTKDLFLMAPTGVHKERVAPSDLFVVDRREALVIRSPKNKTLKLSECSTIFCKLINKRGAGSVMHSHALSAVLAADLAGGKDQIVFRDLEMLKGLRGASNADHHSVPVIHNTAREPELLKQIEEQIDQPRFEKAHCILVRDHGAYIWGADIWETKRHAEVYHFLFEATVARANRRDLGPPHHGERRCIDVPAAGKSRNRRRSTSNRFRRRVQADAGRFIPDRVWLD